MPEATPTPYPNISIDELLNSEELDDDIDMGSEGDEDDRPVETDPDTRTAWERDQRDEATQQQINAELLKNLPPYEWNILVSSMREEDPDWFPDFTDQNLYHASINDRNLQGACFKAATLDGANMSSCDLMEADFENASMYGTNMRYADVTGSNYRKAVSWEQAAWGSTTGYVPPLRDISEEVARHYLREAIGQRDSLVNEGIDAMRASGVRCEWKNSELHFWLAAEVEKQASACSEGECSCEVHHACHGECTCCPCYSGNCECEPDHDYEDYSPTGERYLATVIGRVTYGWSAAHGLRGTLKMSSSSCHPHISSDGSLCLGDAEMPTSLRASDYIVMLLGWVGQHNPADEYRYIGDLPEL